MRLFVALLILASCQSTKSTPRSDLLQQHSASLCAPGETLAGFSLEPTEAVPDFASLGFAGDFSIKKPSAPYNMRVDACVGTGELLKIVRVVEGSVEGNGARSEILRGQDPEIAGFEAAVFGEDVSHLRILIKAAGILPLYLIQGGNVNGKPFIVASRVARFSGTTKLASTQQGWLVGTLVSHDPFPTSNNPCGEQSGEVFATREMTMGTARVEAKVCVNIAVGEGSSRDRVLEIKIVDSNDALPESVRGTRSFTGLAANGMYQGGAGHHGCNPSWTIRLPEVLYHKRDSTLARLRISYIRYKDRKPQREEAVIPGQGNAACDVEDPGDPS